MHRFLGFGKNFLDIFLHVSLVFKVLFLVFAFPFIFCEKLPYQNILQTGQSKNSNFFIFSYYYTNGKISKVSRFTINHDGKRYGPFLEVPVLDYSEDLSALVFAVHIGPKTIQIKKIISNSINTPRPSDFYHKAAYLKFLSGTTDYVAVLKEEDDVEKVFYNSLLYVSLKQMTSFDVFRIHDEQFQILSTFRNENFKNGKRRKNHFITYGMKTYGPYKEIKSPVADTALKQVMFFYRKRLCRWILSHNGREIKQFRKPGKVTLTKDGTAAAFSGKKRDWYIYTHTIDGGYEKKGPYEKTGDILFIKGGEALVWFFQENDKWFLGKYDDKIKISDGFPLKFFYASKDTACFSIERDKREYLSCISLKHPYKTLFQNGPYDKIINVAVAKGGIIEITFRNGDLTYKRIIIPETFFPLLPENLKQTLLPKDLSADSITLPGLHLYHSDKYNGTSVYNEKKFFMINKITP